MKFPDFILQNMESILQAREDFARSVDIPLPAMNAKGLRNHAEYLLKTVSTDMRTSQPEQEQVDKAHGHGPQADDDSSADTHAMMRLIAGFAMDQMVSEYRAVAKAPSSNSEGIGFKALSVCTRRRVTTHRWRVFVSLGGESLYRAQVSRDMALQ